MSVHAIPSSPTLIPTFAEVNTEAKAAEATKPLDAQTIVAQADLPAAALEGSADCAAPALALVEQKV